MDISLQVNVLVEHVLTQLITLKNQNKKYYWSQTVIGYPLRVGDPGGINALVVVKGSESTETMTTRME